MIGSARASAVLVLLGCLSVAACGGSGSSASSSAASSSTSQTVGGSSGTSSGTSTSDGFTISGTVSGITGVAVGLTGTGAGTATTDSSGNFSFATLGAGNYTVVPSKPGYVFSPVSLAVSLSSNSVTALSFTASATTAATYSISGAVAGSAVAGVAVTLNGSNIGSTLTDQSGNYTFSGLLSGTYTVTAALDGYSFSTPLIVSLSDVDSAANDFTSASATGAGLAFSAVSALPQATVGSPYSATVVSSIAGGSAPYSYASATLATGAPPLGMIVNPSGNLTGTPTVPGTYDFGVCATDASGETPDCEPTSITVVTGQSNGPPAPTVTLTASPSTITSGDNAVLSWSSTNATACDASGGWTGAEDVSGTFTVEPTSSTTYVLTCTGAGGSAQSSTLLTVTTSSPKAPTVAMSASPATIPPGSSTTLQWSSKRASACVGSDGWNGSKATSGTHSVTPASTTTYTLACTNSAGTAQTSTKITVKSSAPPPPPTVTLNASPTTISSGGSSTLTWSTTNASSCSASGGWSGTEATSGTQSVSPTNSTTYTLNCTGAGGSGQGSVTVTVGSTGPGGTSWVYFNGAFDWPGDYSYDATPNYNDSSGAPMSGSHDIKITITSSWGGWLPYAQNWNFNSKGYTRLIFSLKPTVANQSWQVFFVKVGDIPVGIYLNPANYGPVPVVGQWGSYSIPLSDLGVLGTSIYKFGIADQTGRSNNVWYVDNVGFAP